MEKPKHYRERYRFAWWPVRVPYIHREELFVAIIWFGHYGIVEDYINGKYKLRYRFRLIGAVYQLYKKNKGKPVYFDLEYKVINKP